MLFLFGRAVSSCFLLRGFVVVWTVLHLVCVVLCRGALCRAVLCNAVLCCLGLCCVVLSGADVCCVVMLLFLLMWSGYALLSCCVVLVRAVFVVWFCVASCSVVLI